MTVKIDRPQLSPEDEKRLDKLAKEAGKPLFLVDQFKVVMKNMNGEPLVPGDDGFGDDDNTPPKIGSAH